MKELREKIIALFAISSLLFIFLNFKETVKEVVYYVYAATLIISAIWVFLKVIIHIFQFIDERHSNKQYCIHTREDCMECMSEENCLYKDKEE